MTPEGSKPGAPGASPPGPQGPPLFFVFFGATAGGVLFASIFLGVAGAIAGTSRILHPGSLNAVAIAGALVLDGLLLFGVWSLGRRRPSPRSDLWLALAGSLSIVNVIAFLLGLPLLDVALDGSRAEVHSVEIVSKREVRVGKTGQGRKILLEVRSWDDPAETVEIEGRGADALPRGSRVRVTTHPGAIGWAWVERVDPPSGHPSP